MNRKIRGLIVAISLSAATCSVATAGQYTGHGWQIDWGDNLDLTFLGFSNDTLVFQKFAVFTSAPGPNGLFAPLPITFTQTSLTAAGTIAIEEEHIFNDTGVTWTGFQMSLASSGNTATFDALRSSSFVTDPFSMKVFTDTTLSLSGGVLSSAFGSDEWRPGRLGGALYINANPSAQGNSVFVLNETPVIPEPTGLAGLLLAAPLLGRRRS